MGVKSSANILVTCAGGAGSLDLVQSLKDSYGIFLCDANPYVAARYAGFPFQEIPFGSHIQFEQRIRELIQKWHIDWIVPGADEELLPLTSLVEQGVVKCVMPQKKFIENCLNKKTLMNILNEKKISNLVPFHTMEKVNFPAIMKPIRGRGSRGVHRVESQDQLQGYLSLYGKKDLDVLVQPYVEGQEYTVSVIVNNRNRLLGIVPKRVISKHGITRAAVSEKNDAIVKTCTHIVEALHPYGPFNVQLKMYEGTCFVFEINPRLSTTAILTEKAFGNEIELCIRYYDCEHCSSLPTLHEGILLLRHEAHCFVNLSEETDINP